MATIILIGNLSRDAETNQQGWTSFTVAETQQFHSDRTNFFNCSAQNLSEAQLKFLTKGKEIEITGDINLTKTETENKTYYGHHIYVTHLRFRGGSSGKKDKTEDITE